MKRSREPEEDYYTPLAADSQDGHAKYCPDTDVALRPVSKFTELDSAIADDDDDTAIAMKCSLPPHKEPLSFKSYAEYDAHYSSFHTNRCLECHKNFPSEHLLGIHIEEFHDPLVIVKRDKGEHTYSCFVEGCERKCLTHQKRRMHMIDKHMYPKDFFFAITRDGIDGRRSLLINSHNRRRSSTGTQTKETRRRESLQGTLEEDKSGLGASTSPRQKSKTADVGIPKTRPPPTDADMADLTGAMSSLKFVPPSIKFGRGRAGFSKT
ncbi:hypothetical protein B0I35DRAFT_473832 [Stachybotrys elegans]|uniref:C2H2-type domain-containing protein n=1 Tax=Stachybotrys elegans TaxID=80388 RepID=A0A8K0T2W6_9HYPO|nr:hypothetical protein B0I35DRAFT_473832 [Stachybotrys elegans]